MDRAMADHLVVTGYAEDYAELPDSGVHLPAEHLFAGNTIRELTQKASWHLASLSRVIDQIEDATGTSLDVPRPRRVGSDPMPRSRLDPGVGSQLTQREQEVLGLLVQGLSNRRIARTLRISESTVKNHMHAIFLKLDVADRTQAIAAVLGGQCRR
jgi:DNA-binding NarL/FixJ family response regulator